MLIMLAYKLGVYSKQYGFLIMLACTLYPFSKSPGRGYRDGGSGFRGFWVWVLGLGFFGFRV